MNRKILKYIILTAWLFLLPVIQPVQADDTPSPEYQIKAAFLYNFLKFVKWPDSKMNDENESIIIGIIGKDVFLNAFENIKDKKIEGKQVIFTRFKGISELQEGSQDGQPKQHPQIETIRESHLLFICPSEKSYTTEIIKSVKEHGVLTVADTQGFLESGGIINLMMEEKKVRFEINMTAAKHANIQIRSQLLRLAKKVLKQETSALESDLPFLAHHTVSYKKPAEKTKGTS